MLLTHPLVNLPLYVLLAGLAAAFPLGAGAAEASPGGAEDMSLVTSLPLVPTPGGVNVDGRDGDWDLSAGVWAYNSPDLVEQHGIWLHGMWSERGVYLLGRVADASPMQNAVLGKDFANSWHNDCVQLRVVFDPDTPQEHQVHVNLFYSTPESKPYMIAHHGGMGDQESGERRPDQLETFGADMLARGGELAFERWPDGKGYNFEAFWPWELVRESGEPLEAGDTFVLGLETMWGNADGTAKHPEHRLADLIKNATVNRIFMFRARDGWGEARLLDHGDLGLTAQQRATQRQRLAAFEDWSTRGSIPIAYTLDEPSDVTIAIDDADGRRVRNLIGQFPREAGSQTDHWDGLDDAGEPVEPGHYTATVLRHDPVELEFFNSVFNSATPPWSTAEKTQLWGSTHGVPAAAARAGDSVLLGFTVTEGGSGVLRVDQNGRILWANKMACNGLAVLDNYAYCAAKDLFHDTFSFHRLDLDTGKLIPFDDEAKSPTIDLAPGKVRTMPDEVAMAAFGGSVWVLLPGVELLQLDPDTGAVTARQPAGELRAITAAGEAFLGAKRGGEVVALDEQGRELVSRFRAEATQPRALAVGPDGQRLAVSDGATNRVLIYGPNGELIDTIGEPYGGDDRPAGTFVQSDLVQPLGLAFDAAGALWTTEANQSSRRVAKWSDDGQLLASFWGGGDYGAMRAFPVPHDSTRFIAHGIEFRLDPDPDPWNRPTAETPLVFHPELKETRGFVYELDGREYAVTLPGMHKQDWFTVNRRDESGAFRPVVRVEYAIKDRPARTWVDRDDDFTVDDGEVGDKFQGRLHYWIAGYARPDLTIFTPDGYRYAPLKFTTAGTPIYNFTDPKKPDNMIEFADRANHGGTLVVDAAGNVSNGIDYHTVDGRRGSYPNPWGRHNAPAARRGRIIAPFRTNGVVEGVPGVGSMTAVGGDRGEWFLMSMDGLYVSAILQDIKGSNTPDETFVGSESFGGFMWRDERGRILVQLGGPSYRLMQVTGLDDAERMSVSLDVTAEQVREGAEMARSTEVAAPAEPGSLRIARVKSLPAGPPAPGKTDAPLIDGAPTVRVQAADDATRSWRAAMAHDGETLAVVFDVADGSPWVNGETRFTHAFIGGDAVDVQLDTSLGPVRLLAAPVAGQDTTVLWQRDGEPENAQPITYVVPNNPANARTFAGVRPAPEAAITHRTGDAGYTVLIRVPLDTLGLKPDAADLRGVLGVIYSDPAGQNRVARLYWHDKETDMVSDVPTESAMNVERWGEIGIEK